MDHKNKFEKAKAILMFEHPYIEPAAAVLKIEDAREKEVPFVEVFILETGG